jgi:diguanylate cyclase (GGDEF)-like protein/PAS domain S-box-containing protein
MTASLAAAADGRCTDKLTTLLALHGMALGAMAHGLCLFDAELRVVLLNRRYRELLGLDAETARPGVALRTILERGSDRPGVCDAPLAQMWRELADLLARGEPFCLRRRMKKGSATVFHFRPTAGGGWVSTCDAPADQSGASSELSTQIERLTLAIENISHGVCLFASDQRLVMCNEPYLRIYGYDRDMMNPGIAFRDMLRQAIKSGMYPGLTLDQLHNRRSALFRQDPASEQLRLSDGRVIEMTVRPVGDDGWIAEHQDITIRVRYEEALRERNQLLDATLEHMAHGLCAFDRDLRVVVVNRRYLDMYGLTEADARPGTTLLELMRHSIARGIHSPGVNAQEMFADFRQRLIDDKEPVLHRRLADGRIIAVRHQPTTNGGWVGTYEDITERHQAQENIARMARHDSLTDLPNRLLFHEKMADGLARVESRKQSMAVMCLDLDNFKAVNDSLGHPLGDKLLQNVAKRLRAALHPSDTIARLGGDEFAVLHSHSTAVDAEALARRLIQAVSDPIVIDGQEINTGISIGITVAPDNGTSGDHLMKCADLALYRAKAEGRNTFRFFEAEMDVQIQARRALEVDLRRALADGEFHLVYQPLVNLATNELVGMEALLRWMRPGRGSVPPSEFIPVAEETGLIIPLGEWVLRQACTEAARWAESVKVAVNLSAVQFRNRNLVAAVTHTLAAAGLSPRRLELEITETVLMQDDELIVAMLHQLRGLGVRIAMDDFGTGYSSLSYLRSFPFDKIKVDRSFLSDTTSNGESEAILRAIAELGATLGIVTTAEGIETTEQLELVRRAGCTEGQGYLISRPRPISDLGEFAALRPQAAAAA